MRMQKLEDVTLRLAHDQRGLTTVEYVVVLCLIVGVAVGTWQAFGDQVLGGLKGAKTDFSDALNKADK